MLDIFFKGEYMLKFNDGVNVDTSKELRTLRLHDGLYVVGGGMLIPVNDQKEADELLKELKGE